MPKRSFANRRELEEHSYHPAILIAVPLFAIFLSSYLPKIWRPLDIFDFPLIVVLYFAVSWRSAIAGTLFGTALGLLQDLPTNLYIGIFGMTKAVLGYVAASIGLKVDVDNLLTRIAMNFGFCLLQSALIFVIFRFLLGAPEYHFRVLHELLRAVLNAAIAVPIFLLLDTTRIE